MHATAALLLTAFLLAACQSAPPPAFDANAEARTLFEADRAFARLAEKTDPRTAFAAYMAPDGMLLPRRSEGAVQGFDKVIASFGADTDPGHQLRWQPQMAEVSKTADMGWTWGQYQVVVDGEVKDSGKYLNVWKRQADGSWKVRADIGNLRPRDAQE